ncbi:Protein of unknown function [Gryllus bimaculatus]|nr:Protein of unknown function [Gryllus bimaculatus]
MPASRHAPPLAPALARARPCGARQLRCPDAVLGPERRPPRMSRRDGQGRSTPPDGRRCRARPRPPRHRRTLRACLPSRRSRPTTRSRFENSCTNASYLLSYVLLVSYSLQELFAERNVVRVSSRTGNSIR